MEERVYKYKPNKIILLIGVNDLLNGKNKEYVLKNLNKIIEGIKKNLPNCKLYVESLYPLNEDWDEYIAKEVPDIDYLIDSINYINDTLKKNSKKYKYKYIDIYTSLLDDDMKLKKEYTYDGLHLNDAGFDVVTKIIKKEVF